MQRNYSQRRKLCSRGRRKGMLALIHFVVATTMLLLRDQNIYTTDAFLGVSPMRRSYTSLTRDAQRNTSGMTRPPHALMDKTLEEEHQQQRYKYRDHEDMEEDLEEAYGMLEAGHSVSIHIPEASRSLWQTVMHHPAVQNGNSTTQNHVSILTTSRPNGTINVLSNTSLPTFAFAYAKEETDRIHGNHERRSSSTPLNTESSVAMNIIAPNGSSKEVSSVSTPTIPQAYSVVSNVPQPETRKQAETRLQEQEEQEFDDTIAYQKSLDAQHRSMWKHRHARTAEEGIRRETTHSRLSNVLAKAGGTLYDSGRHYAARTIRGLIHALAEEVDGLQVQVRARPDTPFWDKQVDAIRIQFARLGFKPLRMGGGADAVLQQHGESTTGASLPERNKAIAARDQSLESSADAPTPLLSAADTTSLVESPSTHLTNVTSVDEAFDRIDVDKSGALDSDEIAHALNLATLEGGDDNDSEKNKVMIHNLATDLVNLYDFNGDGVVDRVEYQSMVEDMAALREAHKRLQEEQLERQDTDEGMFSGVRSFLSDFWAWFRDREDNDSEIKRVSVPSPEEASVVFNQSSVAGKQITNSPKEIIDVSNSPGVVDSMAKAASLGSITVSDLKLDLRRLLFGAIPILKHITPGGPLILEPFTVTVNGSFNRGDIIESNLLDAGLRQLVARALRRRVGSLRDFIEGSVFKGRSWKLISGTGPVVRVPKLTNVEFDDKNRLIITGRARVQSRPDGPVIENAFKLRTRIGTSRGGRAIRLVEPELALVLECPRSLEDSLEKCCSLFKIGKPPRPQPIYAFFPIYSPFKVTDNDGFDLGEDNCIKSINIQDGSLRFELSAVLRPGRFLGNHYIAFTVPMRTFIVTLDRVKEGMRAARKAKQALKARQRISSDQLRRQSAFERVVDKELHDHDESATKTQTNHRKRTKLKGFFSRFVDGYLQAEKEDVSEKERMTNAIRDFFGKQSNTTRAAIE